MQVILEVTSGAQAGKRFWLAASQSQTVGRTARAGFVVSSDARMSSVHFAVECGALECRLRDLGSSNGTFLNDQRVQSATLYEGDVIRAGDTSFAVNIKGVAAKPVGRAAAPSTDPPAATQRSPQATSRKSISFRTYPCRSKLTLMRGVSSKFDVAEICSRLSGLAPMYVVATSGQSEMSGVEEFNPAERLFDWIPHEQTEAGGPFILGPAAGDAWSPLAARLWGKDAALYIFDGRPAAVVSRQLRQFAHSRHGRPETMDLAHFRPSVMCEFLANGEPDEVASATQGIEAILLEVHQGERWAVLGKKGVESRLQHVGLCEAPPWV